MTKRTFSMSTCTRRDILAAFLGMPLAMAGCSKPAPGRSFGGEIVGASEGIGHRLRDGWRPTPAADQWRRVGVVIVGGGVAGLSAARRLLQAGCRDFRVLELEAEAGGTSRFGTSSLVPYPWGAHYIPAPMKENRLLVDLLDEMGILEGRDRAGEPIVGEQYLCRDPQERIFYKGRWYEGLYLHAGATSDDDEQFKGFRAEVDRWVGWRDTRGRRAFALPMAAGSDDAEVTALDKISMADWLERHQFASPRLRWLVNYACRDDYGTTTEETSAWAGLFYFASRQRKPGAEAQPLITWPEGNGRIVAHLQRQVRDQMLLGRAVADILPVEDADRRGVDVIAVDPVNSTAFGYHADQVIFAAPQFLTRVLVRPYRTQTPSHLAAFDYGAWMVANLFLKDRPAGSGFPLCWDNVLYESPSLGYVVATHQRGLDHGPTVFTYYYPLCDANAAAARSKLASLGWQDWADVALTDLRRAHPGIDPLVERLDIMRWGHAMVRPRPGFVWGGARAAASRPYRGIHFAHADLSGIGLFEEAHYQGVRAAEEVLTVRGLPFQSLL